MDKPEDRDALRGFLAERDVPCPSCRYNLRGLQGEACPECGLGLELGVHLTEPATGALLATLAGLFAGIGAAGSVVAGFVVISIGWGWSGVGVLLVPMATLIALIPGASALCGRRGRVWFRNRTPVTRARVATLAWAVTLAAFAAFMLHAIAY